MSNRARFEALLAVDGSTVVFHREEGGTLCPCRTPEGYRDPIWHKAHPLDPVCNEAGILPGVVTNKTVKAFIQPAQSAAVRRLTTEYVSAMFGEIQGDDHLGIFPIEWDGVTLDFENWSQAGEDFVSYDDKRFLVVNSNKIPDPDGGFPHHYEVGLRLMKTARPI